MITHIVDDASNYDTMEIEQACMSLVLAHELAHTFGMNDVYNNEEHKADNNNCIMDGGDTSEMAEYCYNLIYGEENVYAFCDSCFSTLRKHFEGQPMWTYMEAYL